MINLDTYEAKMAFVHQLNAECNIFQGEDMMEEDDNSIPYSGKYFDAFPTMLIKVARGTEYRCI